METITENRGPEELVKFFLALVEPIDKRYQLALKYHMWGYAVDVAVVMKDKEKISMLKSTLVEYLGATGSIELRERLDRVVIK